MSLRDADLVAHLPGLQRYALVLTQDPERAQDLVQDTLLRALEAGATFRGESGLATWLHRVMHNLFVDQVRARRADPTPDDQLIEAVERAWRSDAYTVDAEAVLARAQVRDDLLDALTHLPDALRTTVVLHDTEGWSCPQIAEVEGATVAAVKQRLRRGRSALVTLLAEDADRRAAMKGVPMRCWQARSRVDDYLAGELEPGSARELERHLETCPTCPALYASLVGVVDAVGKLRDPNSVIPDHLRRQVAGRSSGPAT